MLLAVDDLDDHRQVGRVGDDVDIERPFLMVVQHPVTTETDNRRYLENVLAKTRIFDADGKRYLDFVEYAGVSAIRQGVNGLHVTRTVLVTPETIRSLLGLRETACPARNARSA